MKHLLFRNGTRRVKGLPVGDRNIADGSVFLILITVDL